MTRQKRSGSYCGAFAARFREALDLLGETPVTVYGKLGYSNPSTLYSIVSGRCLPDIAKLASLSELRCPNGRRVNIDWLLTGCGDKLLVVPTTKKKRSKVEAILERCTQRQLAALLTVLEERDAAAS